MLQGLSLAHILVYMKEGGTMIRKVSDAKIGGSVTRYDDLWVGKLECGHALRVPRKGRYKDKSPKRVDCGECDKALQAESVTSVTGK
jgi:hypothetical protein